MAKSSIHMPRTRYKVRKYSFSSLHWANSCSLSDKISKSIAMAKSKAPKIFSKDP